MAPSHSAKHRFDDAFEREAHELYDELVGSRFEPALETLNLTLRDLVKTNFNPGICQ